ncbi:hypothetical protein [Paracoccus thiocyanatus]|uniref:hypothetical protein n=1 Tax=Paracoccus thiocyanatus TaxID=34006 RepID=UPI00216372A6|nr:hypothetical protein [Paracoccus thiocyanatus]
MAKRRRLATPSSADLDRIEEQFRSETYERPALGRGIAPIAQVAGDSAALSSAESTESRAGRARPRPTRPAARPTMPPMPPRMPPPRPMTPQTRQPTPPKRCRSRPPT